MIGLRLKEERKKRKYTQEDLANLVNSSKRSVLMYEKNETTIPSSFFEKIANLGFDVQYIITGVRSESSPLSPEEKEILQLYHGAGKEIQKACKAMLLSGQKAGHTVSVKGNNNIIDIN